MLRQQSSWARRFEHLNAAATGSRASTSIAPQVIYQDLLPFMLASLHPVGDGGLAQSVSLILANATSSSSDAKLTEVCSCKVSA